MIDDEELFERMRDNMHSIAKYGKTLDNESDRYEYWEKEYPEAKIKKALQEYLIDEETLKNWLNDLNDYKTIMIILTMSFNKLSEKEYSEFFLEAMHPKYSALLGFTEKESLEYLKEIENKSEKEIISFIEALIPTLYKV